MAKEVLEMEVKSNIKSVIKETDELGVALKETSEIGTKGMKEMSSSTKNSSDNMQDLANSTTTAAKKNEHLTTSTGLGTLAFRKLKNGVLALGTALKAIGIGLLIGAFVALQEALQRNQKVMDTVNTIMTTISTTFNQVIDVLVDTYKWVGESTDRFNGLGKVMSGILTLVINPFKLAFLQIKGAVQLAELAWKNSFLGGRGKDVERIAELRKGIMETGEAIADTVKSTINAGKDIITNFGDAVGEVGSIGKMVVEGISEVSIKANHEQAKSTVAAQNSAKLAEAALQGLIEKNDLLAEKQRQIRDDETKTFAERIEANNQLGEVLNQQEVDMLALADTRVAAAALELEQNKNNIDLQIAYQQTLNDRAGVEAQVAGFRSEQLTNQVSLEKELGETQKEILAEGLKGMARELQELQSSYEARVKMAEKAGMEINDITEQYEQEQDAIRRSHMQPLLDLQNENSLALIENLHERALAELKIQEDKDLAAAELMENSEAIKEQILIKYDRQRAAAIKAQAKLEMKWADMTAKEKLNVASQVAGGLSQIMGEETAAGKAMAIAQATINTYSAAAAALAPPPIGAGPVLGPVLAGVAIASGIKNIQEIAKAGGGGGGGGNISASTAPQAPAPQMMSGEFQLGGGVEPDPVKAFVVTDEMSSSQNQLANIRRQATI